MLFKLLTAPVSLPMAGMKFVFQQIAEMADAELNDESVVREQLLLLQVQLEDGDIDEAEYREQEAALVQRLREIRARQRAQQAQPAETAEDAAPADAADPTGGRARPRRRVVIETPFDSDPH